MVNELYRFARLAASGPGSLEADMLATAADDRWCLLAYAEARPDQIGALTLSAALRHGATHGVRFGHVTKGASA